MTEKDLEIELLRSRVKELEAEVTFLKGMQRKMVQYVPTEALATMAIDMMPKPVIREIDEDFWRGE